MPNIHQIRIVPDPLPKDNGRTDVFRGEDGKFYTAYGDLPGFETEDALLVEAIKIKVEGRGRSFFVAATRSNIKQHLPNRF